VLARRVILAEEELAKMAQKKRTVWFLLSTILVCAFLGRIYGQRVEATTTDDDSDFRASSNEFSNILNLVQDNYADPVDPDRAIYGVPNSSLGAIPGMLRTLDPHSNFLDPRTFELFQEEQRGRYYGVGMRIGPIPGKMGKMVTIVVQPMPGSPAFNAGLRPGDIIVRVDGKSTEGLNTTQVASLLKGPKGTYVHVSIDREGSDAPLEFKIMRDEISPRSVDDAFFIRPHVGYVHISSFNETTNDELTEELKKFDPKTLQGLILDLRDNPGGLLQEAVEVADHFLEKNQLIVYHYGRRSREKRYYASKGNDGNEYPIVVLVNRMSASAAEIVTGALQDHDRALVMGEPSFGKGLVQSEYPLSEKTMLLLTTARYYTPSGRLIQRNYANVSLYDYYYHYEDKNLPHTEVRLTDGGREVYGGGGIMPDIRFADAKLNSVEERLTQRGTFFNFSKYYLGIHKTIPRDFTADASVLAEFKKFANDQDASLSDAELQANLDFIKNHIESLLIGMIYGQNEANKLTIADDPLVQKALNSMTQAADLLANAKKYMASRSQTKMNQPQ
jgi:carboxyl-terminal processing protease